ncbi:hypothetical protein HYH02_006146 [Chlamydomonas schloesseri]|uniref:Uncharacterized protein n=1 Tax=Chlamydomonas schloesseri TaxID=2026947 RepID=A0A835WJW9_9CHLO|nr:hypothetical protein HYH02_006146 [Chlamydomonas schloesseri]|eukprot:KAG2448795.1 hypothetical protein HYH02_006146 [Chlamydomonas schloesseri]
MGVKGPPMGGAGTSGRTASVDGLLLAAYTARARLGMDLVGGWVMAAMLLVYMRTSVVETGCGAEVAAGRALPDFPCGGAPILQVLHVMCNAPFYAIMRPIRLSDWACLVAACGYAAPAPLLTLLAVASTRPTRVWRWWARYRDLLLGLRMFILTTFLHVISYLLLPRDQWLQSGFAAYSNAIVTRPIADALSISCVWVLFPTRLSVVLPLAACRGALAFVLSTSVGPVVVPALWQASGRANSSTRTSALDLPCQPVLLSRMPAPMKLLVALLYVALPAAVCFVAELHVRQGFAAHVQQQLQRQRQQQQQACPGSCTEQQDVAPQVEPQAEAARVSGDATAVTGHMASDQGGACSSGARAPRKALAGPEWPPLLADTSFCGERAAAVMSSAAGSRVTISSGSAAASTAVRLDSDCQVTAWSAGSCTSSSVTSGPASSSRNSTGTRSGSGTGADATSCKAPADILLPTAAARLLAPSGSEPCSEANTETDLPLLVRKPPQQQQQQQPQQQQQQAAAAGRWLGPSQAQPHVLTATLVARAAPAAAHVSARASVAKAPLQPYQGLTSLRHISVKVQQHPGSFESYSHRLVQAAPGIMAAAAAAQGPCGVAVPQQLTQALVVRGCAQLIAWQHGLVVGGPGAAAKQLAPGACMPDSAESTPWLFGLLPDRDAVSGVAWQAAAPGWSISSSASAPTTAAVQLLHLSPPVLPLTSAAPAADAQPPTPHEPLRLRLFSPQPQRARLIVAGSSRNGSHGDAGPATAATAVGLRTQQVLAELQVQLCAGEQELELGGGLLQQLLLQAAGSCVSGAAAGETAVSRGRALQLLLLPPEHDDNEQADAAEVVEPGAPAPLLHFAAPLLVLPADAAAELCGLWGQVAAEAGGDAAAAHAHLQPLLSDLCYVLEAAQAEAEEAAEVEDAGDGPGQVRAAAGRDGMVGTAVLAYLHQAGLAASAHMVRSLCSHGATATPSGTSQLPKASTAAPATSSSSYALAVVSSSCPSRLAAAALLHGFSPRQLETQFEAWRALRLARAAPFLLAMTAQPYLLGLIRTVAEQPHAVVVQTLLLILTLWITDILGSLVLLLRMRACARLARAAAPHGEALDLARALPGSLQHHYSRLYHVACVYVAPALFLAASIASRLRPLPSNDAFIGNPRVLLGSALSRGLVLPSVQQLSWRQAAAAAVLLAPGEALQVAALQPGMWWGCVVALVVGWRAAACATAAAWEWRARSHFVVLQTRALQEQPGAVEHKKNA